MALKARIVLGLVLLAWVGLGFHGLASYGSDYAVYRGFPAPKDPPGVAAGTTQQVTFRSKALGQDRSYTAYLPAGYAADRARGEHLGVLYLLHGSPGQPRTFFTAGQTGVTYDELLQQHRVPPFITIVPDGRTSQWAHDDSEWADVGTARYASFVADVVRDVEHRFGAAPGVDHRVVAGLSMGGYGAANLTLRYPTLFRSFEAWSGYFLQEREGPFTDATAAQIRAQSPLLAVRHLHPGPRGRRTIQADFLVGTTDSYRRQTARFARALDATGAATVRTRSLPGGHSWAVWRGGMAASLTWAGARLGAPTVGP